MIRRFFCGRGREPDDTEMAVKDGQARILHSHCGQEPEYPVLPEAGIDSGRSSCPCGGNGKASDTTALRCDSPGSSGSGSGFSGYRTCGADHKAPGPDSAPARDCACPGSRYAFRPAPKMARYSSGKKCIQCGGAQNQDSAGPGANGNTAKLSGSDGCIRRRNPCATTRAFQIHGHRPINLSKTEKVWDKA